MGTTVHPLLNNQLALPLIQRPLKTTIIAPIIIAITLNIRNQDNNINMMLTLIIVIMVMLLWILMLLLLLLLLLPLLLLLLRHLHLQLHRVVHLHHLQHLAALHPLLHQLLTSKRWKELLCNSKKPMNKQIKPTHSHIIYKKSRLIFFFLYLIKTL